MKIFTNIRSYILVLFLMPACAFSQVDGWKLVNEDGGMIQSMVLDDHGWMFAAPLLNGVLRSSDNGKRWTTLDSGLADISANGIISLGKRALFIATSDGIYHSSNDGFTWQKWFGGFHSSVYYNFLLLSNGTLFAGGQFDGVIRSTDHGRTWTQAGMKTQSVHCMAVAPDGVLFAGTESEGVYRSTDHGKTWVPSNTGIAHLYVASLATDTLGTVYAGTVDSCIFRSTDGGVTWKRTIPIDVSVFAITVDNQGNVYAGTNGRGVFRSADHGATWTLFGTGFDIASVNAMLFMPDGELYAAVSRGLYHIKAAPPNAHQ